MMNLIIDELSTSVGQGIFSRKRCITGQRTKETALVIHVL